MNTHNEFNRSRNPLEFGTCIKQVYAIHEVHREVEKLKRESPECVWSFYFCEECPGYHILRSLKGTAR